MTLNPITSDLLSPVSHGFFTRQGGASSGIFEGLNCGLGSSDLREAVMLNRARVAEAANNSAKAVSLYEQVDGPQKREAVLRIRDLKKGETDSSPEATQ